VLGAVQLAEITVSASLRRARTDRWERLLVGAARAGLALNRRGRTRRVVRLIDARAARCRQRVPGDLPRPALAVGVNDDELAAVRARPHAVIDER
jgi:hypothetical protein